MVTECYGSSLIKNNPCIVYIQEKLDYEVTQEYTLTLRVTDIVSNAFSEVLVNVVVADINDCVPKFDADYYNVSVSENSPVGALVFEVTANDNDTVLNVNDNPPKFSQTLYTCWLSEEASRGQLVTMVAAYDPDFDRLYYNIVSGNQYHIFSINQFSGVLSVANRHHLGEEQNHTVNVSATDGVHISFAQVYIEIVLANRNSPQLHQQKYTACVQENLPAGTPVVTVFATDSDSGIYGKIIYSIPSQLFLQTFHINNITGEIWTNKRLDREKQALYELPVVATDGGGRSSWGIVHITVSDVNDNAPVFQLNEYRISIYSNLTINSVFLKVRAEDQDEGNSAKIEYSIFEPYKNITKSLFAIHTHSGSLYLLTPALAYENQVFQFFVRATDSGTPTLYTDVPVFIHIMRNHEISPVFHKGNEKFFLPENIKPGTVAAKVKVVSNKAVNFKLLSGTSAFIINSAGEIRTIHNLDRETAETYVLGVLALTHTSPPLAAFTEVSVQLLDVNDNAPYFHNDNYSIVLPENTPQASSVFKVYAEDLDEASNGEIQFSLSGDKTPFSVDPYSGWISMVSNLDKEAVSSYILTLTATDSGTPVLSSTSLFHVNIIDYNDNPPVSDKESYHIDVREDASVESVITQISVRDKDTDMKNNIKYCIIDGDYHSQFTVLPTGHVRIVRPLDRENQEKYSLTIAATDTKFVSVVQLHVTVLDVNDEKPKCLHTKYQQVVSEALSPGLYICTILVVDADIQPKLNYYITGDRSQQFYVDELTGELKAGQGLDREKCDHYMLTVHVQDKEIPQWECVSYVDILVSDVNDNSPHFDLDNYIVSIHKNIPVRSPVFKLQATDCDTGINRRIHYYLEDMGSGYFDVDRETGLITVAKPLNEESKSEYLLTVKAIDEGLPQLSSNVSVKVKLLDVSESSPEFQCNFYSATVPENATKGSEVIQVNATSRATGLSLQVFYSIVAGNDDGKFRINSKTGKIIVAELLDREHKSSYLLTVSAADMGSSPISSHTIVNVAVLDVNDNAPVFTHISYIVQVSEETQIGSIVLEVTAVDLDYCDNGKVQYSLTDGDLYQEFYVHLHTGQLVITKPLDREKVPHYELNIKATDNGQPQLSSVVNVSINVLDVNDNAPQFSQSNFTVLVKEDKPPGWTVYQLSVSDRDTFPNADPYIYRVLYDDSGGTIILKPDGTLKTDAVLNSKLQNQYSVHIRVYDNGMPHLYSETWIIVKVIGESQFPPVAYPLDILVIAYQDHWSGTELGGVMVTDEDPYDSFSYSIYPPTLDGPFKVNATTGVLETITGLDAGQYIVNVSVSDSKFVSYVAVTVTVKPLWDNVLKHSVGVRLPRISSHEFLTNGLRDLVYLLESELQTNVSVISIQSVPHSDLDVLLAFSEEIDLITLSNILYSGGYGNMTVPCECPKDAACRQQISVNSDFMVTHSTNRTSFVSPSFSHELYCSCASGSVGGQCEEVLASIECMCPTPQVCVPQPETLGYKCQSPHMCPDNQTCITPVSMTVISNKWKEIVSFCACVITVILLAGSFVLYRRFQKTNHRRIQSTDKAHYSHDVAGKQEDTKLSELDVTLIFSPFTKSCSESQSGTILLSSTNKNSNLITKNHETPEHTLHQKTTSIPSLDVQTAEVTDLDPESATKKAIIYGFPFSTSQIGSCETSS